MSRLTPSLLSLDKGLDLQTAKILAPEGSVFDTLNYEQVDFQGQKRIDGYVRYDGSKRSDSNDYIVVSFDSDVSQQEGYLVINNNVPVAIVVEQVTNNELAMIVINEVEAPYVGDSILGSTVISVVDGKDYGLTVEEHYEKVLQYNNIVRQNTESLPEGIIGLHWFRDRLYAVSSMQTFVSGVVLNVAGPSMAPILATVSISYNATGGEGTYSYQVTSGALPPSLTLDSSTGILSGTVTTSGTYSWEVTVTDSGGTSDSVSSTFKVVEGNVTGQLLTTLPPSGGSSVIKWSHDSKYLAISSSSASPYLWVYKREGDSLQLLSLPSTGMTSRAQGLAWSSDSNELAVSPEASVESFLLKRTGDTFVLETLGLNPSGPQQERGLVYNTDYSNLYLTTATAVYGWSVDGDTYTSLDKIVDLPANSFAKQASDYSSEGNLFVTGLTASPWVSMHLASGNTLTPVAAPSGISSEARQTRFSPDSNYLGWATTISPYYKLYQKTAPATFSEITSLPVGSAVTGSTGCFEWGPLSLNFAQGGANARVFKRVGNTITLNATLPSTNVSAMSWSSDGDYLAVVRTGGTDIYKITIV